MHVLLNCLSPEIQTIKWGARENKGQTVNDRRNSNAQMGGSILRYTLLWLNYLSFSFLFVK